MTTTTPKISITKHHITTVDPNAQYPVIAAQNLYNACGVLLPWVLLYFRDVKAAPTLKAHMTELYGFGDLFPLRMTHHTDDSLSYPGDPDIYPLISIEQPSPSDPPLRVLIYQYAIIAFIENGQTFITRMD